ncbi:hypothetical protein GX51_01476 [Blastomyces parvus]|uniref:Uncharacterized protein n=1 Tax=Blastomyces parvus TaxID=2060905 RepID=A0A2B7XGI6_9EURO|nr:hypothetical protein GX51_01476 [Blastomyces parvus]
MAPAYRLSLTRVSLPANGVVWLPGTVGVVLRVYCEGPTSSEGPFKDIGVTCITTTTNGSDGQLVSSHERWYSLGNFTPPKQDNSSSLVLALLADLKDIGNVNIKFCVKKKLEDGTLQLMPGSEEEVREPIRTMDLEQVKKETEEQLNK